ncbi:MAG: type IV pilus assembly protein PilM [Sedimentisphaerales bacterium]
MAEKIGSVWAIDIGNTSLKAMRLSNESGTLEVTGFDHIQHGKILSGTGVKDQEKQELIALTLRQFAQQNDVGSDDIIVAVPSQNSFARFVNLPPVEQKRIPEIVKFEASQQIPFEISEVTWDWQMMTEEGATEAKVGIFAIKNEVVTSELEHFSRENLEVSYVQISPMALYNYLVFDRPDLTKSNSQATVVINIGAENTDLVVCTKSDVWQRAIPMGGNAFTKAIADTFKLSFEKAEKLKRTAPMSKYARQILQAMKPVFGELTGEIQRSLGFYTSAHPNSKIARIVALGGGTKMRGLLQYLQQSLQVPIERPDAFKRLGINAAVSAAKFHDSVADFGVVYGLGVQALGLGKIESNLLPKSVARSSAWARKTKYFIAAACLILIASILTFARTLTDQSSYRDKASVRERSKKVVDDAKKAEEDLKAEKNRATTSEAIIKREMDLLKYREVVPLVNQTLLSVMPNEKNNPAQKELYEAFKKGDTEKIKTEFKQRNERKQLFITGMTVYFSPDLNNARFGENQFQSGSAGGGKSKGPSQMDMDGMMRQMMQAMSGGKAPVTAPTRRAASGSQSVTGQEQTADRGFVVSISGYCPYSDVRSLIEPAGVKDDPNKWGVITRLMNINKFYDGNCPFELFGKTTQKENFELQTGPVDLTAQMPGGIGVRKPLDNGSDVLIDPMTKEIISRVEKKDEAGKKVVDKKGSSLYEINDQWFILNLKLKWKDAPMLAESEKQGA